MNKLRYNQPGTAPATLIAPPEQKGQRPEVSLIEYDAHTILEKKIERIDEISSCLENDKISWINIGGLGDVELLKELGILFRIHYFPLIENSLAPGVVF